MLSPQEQAVEEQAIVEQEWALATDYFQQFPTAQYLEQNHQDGQRCLNFEAWYKNHTFESKENNQAVIATWFNQYKERTLTRSFLKGEDGKIYMLEFEIGAGREDEEVDERVLVIVASCSATDRYSVAIKVISFTNLNRSISRLNNETHALEDLGLLAGKVIQRLLANGKTKVYIPMKYCGVNLYDYLNNPSLSRTERYNLFIMACRLIDRLHKGQLSQTKIKYVHRDLKPENIAVNPIADREVDMRVIDVESVKGGSINAGGGRVYWD